MSANRQPTIAVPPEPSPAPEIRYGEVSWERIDVRLVDGSWPGRLSPELGARLQSLLDNPEG